MKKLALFLALPFFSLLADDCDCWRVVSGIEIGAIRSSDAGSSKTFRSESPNDEFYKYSPSHKSQNRAIYGVFAGAAWRGLCDWDFQVDLKYSQSSPFTAKGTLTQGLDVQSQDSYNYRYKISLKQLLVEAKFSYVNCSLFRPYVSIGLGSSFNRSYSFSTTVPESLTFTRAYKSHTTSGFSYAIGFGVDVEISSCVYAG